MDLDDLLRADLLKEISREHREDLKQLVEEVFLANLLLSESGLAPLTWGNVSGLTSCGRFMVIKPSGVSYEELTAEDMVVVELASAEVVSINGLNPSTDTPTHLHLYRSFPELRGISHTHSPKATAFAQAEREIPCVGTTHADNSVGPILLTDTMSFEETRVDYELNTGRKIVDKLKEQGRLVTETPGILVREHGVFAWSLKGAKASVEAAIAIEEIARLAFFTTRILLTKDSINPALAEKHFKRKHGPDAYYGQVKRTSCKGKTSCEDKKD